MFTVCGDFIIGICNSPYDCSLLNKQHFSLFNMFEEFEEFHVQCSALFALPLPLTDNRQVTRPHVHGRGTWHYSGSSPCQTGRLGLKLPFECWPCRPCADATATTPLSLTYLWYLSRRDDVHWVRGIVQAVSQSPNTRSYLANKWV